MIDPLPLVGDLNLRQDGGSTLVSGKALVQRWLAAWAGRPRQEEAPVLLALDWTGETSELLIGRHDQCDIVVPDPTVSRLHARLIFRDAKWIIQDLRSTNGTTVNGTYVGRCVVQPGDRLMLGDKQLAID
jgi:hypothetical protein